MSFYGKWNQEFKKFPQSLKAGKSTNSLLLGIAKEKQDLEQMWHRYVNLKSGDWEHEELDSLAVATLLNKETSLNFIRLLIIHYYTQFYEKG